MTSDAEALLAEGNRLVKQGRFAEAAERFRGAVALEPLVNAWVSLGACLTELGQKEEGLACYETALLLEPDNAFALKNKSAWLFNAHRFEESLAVTDRLLAFDPMSAEDWTDRCLSLFQLFRHEEALDSAERAVALEPKLARAWEMKTECELKLNRHRKAVRSLTERAALGFDAQGAAGALKILQFMGEKAHIHPLFCAALAAMMSQKFSEALGHLEGVLYDEPTWSDPWSCKATLQVYFKRYPEALACLDRALSLDPADARIWLAKSMILKALGKPEEALAGLDEGLRRDPKQLFLWKEKAVILFELDRRQEALRCLRLTLSARPSQERISRLLEESVRELLLTGKSLDLLALAQELTALPFSPSAPPAPISAAAPAPAAAPPSDAVKPAAVMDADYWCQQGDQLRSRMDWQAALRAYGNGVAKDRKHFASWLGMALCQAKRKLFEESRDSFEKALALSPENRDAILHKGKLHFEANKFGTALEAFSRLAKKDSTDAEAWLHKAQCEVRLKRNQEAGRSLAALSALKLTPEQADLSARLRQLV